MTFLGQAAITAPTRTTARALLVTAALLAMIQIGWVQVDGLTVFEATLAEGRTESALCALAGFLMAAHAAQWIGDYLSYRAWNVIGADTHVTSAYGSSQTDRKIDAAVKRVARLLREEAGVGNTEWKGKEIAAVTAQLESLNVSIKRFRLYAVFYVWVWYGALPVLVALSVIAWSLHG